MQLRRSLPRVPTHVPTPKKRGKVRISHIWYTAIYAFTLSDPRGSFVCSLSWRESNSMDSFHRSSIHSVSILFYFRTLSAWHWITMIARVLAEYLNEESKFGTFNRSVSPLQLASICNRPSWWSLASVSKSEARYSLFGVHHQYSVDFDCPWRLSTTILPSKSKVLA